MAKILILGAGRVGEAVAFACTFLPQQPEIFIYDINTKKQAALIADLSDGNSRTILQNEIYLQEIDYVINCAGKSQLLHTSREDEFAATLEITKSLSKMFKGFRGVFINVSNPCDKVTALFARLAGLQGGRCFGTGTALEMARMGSAEYPIIGAHGEDNMLLTEKKEVVAKYQKVKKKVWEIIDGKGVSCCGIANVVFSLLNSMLDNKITRQVLCVYHPNTGQYFSDCCLLSKEGIVGIQTPALTPAQKIELDKIVKSINNVLRN